MPMNRLRYVSLAVGLALAMSPMTAWAQEVSSDAAAPQALESAAPTNAEAAALQQMAAAEDEAIA